MDASLVAALCLVCSALSGWISRRKPGIDRDDVDKMIREQAVLKAQAGEACATHCAFIPKQESLSFKVERAWDLAHAANNAATGALGGTALLTTRVDAREKLGDERHAEMQRRLEALERTKIPA